MTEALAVTQPTFVIKGEIVTKILRKTPSTITLSSSKELAVEKRKSRPIVSKSKKDEVKLSPDTLSSEGKPGEDVEHPLTSHSSSSVKSMKIRHEKKSVSKKRATGETIDREGSSLTRVTSRLEGKTDLKILLLKCSECKLHLLNSYSDQVFDQSRKCGEFWKIWTLRSVRSWIRSVSRRRRSDCADGNTNHLVPNLLFVFARLRETHFSSCKNLPPQALGPNGSVA